MWKWTVKNRRELMGGRIFKILRLECFHPGKEVDHDFYIIESPDWINITALTEDNRFIMVRQHRLGTDECTMETPAGLMEKGEDPLEASKRELLEETGYEAKDLVLLKKLTANPSIMNNSIYFYLATGCRKISDQKLDMAEDIDIILHTPGEVIRMLQDGSINHSIIVTALSLYFLSPFFHEGSGGATPLIF